MRGREVVLAFCFGRLTELLSLDIPSFFMWNLYPFLCPPSSVVLAHPEPSIPSQLHCSKEGFLGGCLMSAVVKSKSASVSGLCLLQPTV